MDKSPYSHLMSPQRLPTNYPLRLLAVKFRSIYSKLRIETEK